MQPTNEQMALFSLTLNAASDAGFAWLRAHMVHDRSTGRIRRYQKICTSNIIIPWNRSFQEKERSLNVTSVRTWPAMVNYRIVFQPVPMALIISAMKMKMLFPMVPKLFV